MYEVSCIRRNELMYLWADRLDLNCWCVSKTPYCFRSLSDAQFIVDQVTSVRASDLQNVIVHEVE